jgi:Flp pilus assembly protein TadD
VKRGGSVVDQLLAQARKALAGGDAGEARMLAERVVQLDPARATGYIVLGGALDALGDRTGMSVAFRKCSENARDGLVTACRALAR